MHDLQTLNRLNLEACGKGEPRPPYDLRFHPQICELRREIGNYSVSAEYHRWLRYALWRYSDQLVARKEPPTAEGWSNLEALQQVALGDMMEYSLRASMGAQGL